MLKVKSLQCTQNTLYLLESSQQHCYDSSDMRNCGWINKQISHTHTHTYTHTHTHTHTHTPTHTHKLVHLHSTTAPSTSFIITNTCVNIGITLGLVHNNYDAGGTVSVTSIVGKNRDFSWSDNILDIQKFGNMIG